MNSPATTIETDVLVIGGGVAGARAGAEALENGVDVVMTMKRPFGKGGASCVYPWYAGFGLPNGDTDPYDSPEEFFKDTISAASGMCDEKLVRILCSETIDRFNDLEKWGLDNVYKVGNKYRQVKSCFSSRPRAIEASGLGISPSIVNLLRSRIENHGAKVIENIMIVKLLVNSSVCVGAIGITDQGEFVVFKAKSTVLATGGGAAIFPHGEYPIDASGDGYVLGFRAGADLANMEFIQLSGKKGVFPGIEYLCPELYNKLGDRFFSQYLPKGITAEDSFKHRSTHGPFSTRDSGKWVDISIYKELSEGRGPIYMDFTKITKEKIEQAKEETKGGYFGGLGYLLDLHRKPGSKIPDYLTKPAQVTTNAHAFNGGLKINEHTETTLPGLFAIGEAATGVHGADRPGGNMQSACQVFGARAGIFAALRAKTLDRVHVNETQIEESVNRVECMINSRGGIGPQEIKANINDIMWKHCLLVRNQEGLGVCLQKIRRIREEELPKLRVENKTDLFPALEIANLLDVAQIVIYAANERKESRGGHYRDDYPERDDRNWLKTITVNQNTVKMS